MCRANEDSFTPPDDFAPTRRIRSIRLRISLLGCINCERQKCSRLTGGQLAPCLSRQPGSYPEFGAIIPAGSSNQRPEPQASNSDHSVLDLFVSVSGKDLPI